MLLESNEATVRVVELSAIDMHCMPGIILELQSALPFYPDAAFSTKRVSSFIWEYSSAFNVRYSEDNDLQMSKNKFAFEALREI